MTTILRASLAVFALALVFSAYAFADGGTDFKRKCAACHGTTGKGDTPTGNYLKIKDLARADVQNESDADLTTIILHGKGKMPGYTGKISEAQISDLVEYIRTLK